VKGQTHIRSSTYLLEVEVSCFSTLSLLPEICKKDTVSIRLLANTNSNRLSWCTLQILTGLGFRELSLTDAVERSFPFRLKTKILKLVWLRGHTNVCALFWRKSARLGGTLEKLKKTINDQKT
jgi:hypothetical protein